MVNDHYGRQKGNPLPPHIIPVVVHWLEREIVQWAKEKNGSSDRSFMVDPLTGGRKEGNV